MAEKNIIDFIIIFSLLLGDRVEYFSIFLVTIICKDTQSSNNWSFGGTAISPAIRALHLVWLDSAPGQLQNSGKQSLTYSITFSYQSLTSP